MVVEPDLPQKTNNENMSARTPSQISVDNSLAGQDDEALPPVMDAQGNPVPLDDLTPPDDEMVDPPVPAEIRRATANVQPTGVHFNLEPFKQIAALHQAGRTDEARAVYQGLDPQARYVYDNIRNMKRVPASEAARLADEFRQKQDQLSTPQAREAERRIAAAEDKSKEGAQKTYQRASNMLFLLDNLRGGKRDKFTEEAEGTEKWRKRVGTIQGRWPSMLSDGETLGWNADFASLKGMINLDEAVRNAGQGSLSDGERALMAQAASLGLEQARDEPGFKAAFERMYDMALEAQQNSMSKLSGEQGSSGAAPAAGASTAQQQTRKVGNQTWVKTKDGWLPQR